MLLQRFALFDDAEAGDAYLDQMPARVVRIRPESPREITAMEIPGRALRASGESERTLEPALDMMEAAIRASFEGSNITDTTIVDALAVSLFARPSGCIDSLRNCLGEVSDTVYSIGPVALDGIGVGDPVTLGDAPGERFIAFGVNHAAFGRATYSNVVVMNTNRLAGVVAFDSRQMPGSADTYLDAHPDRAELFAVTIMRDCGAEPHCIEVPRGFPGVDADEPISFMFRAYVQPGASVSPNPRELLPERVLHIIP